MAMIRTSIDLNNPVPLTKEQLAELAEAEAAPINFKDIPKMTPEEIERIRQLRREGKTREFTRMYLEEQRLREEKKRKKKMFCLRIQDQTIKWWKETVGEGYTGIMSKLLDKATNHPEWIKECL